MKRPFPFAILALAIFAVSPSGLEAADLDRSQLAKVFNEQVKPFLKANCFSCHGKKKQEAKLNLSGFGSVEQVVKRFSVWDIVLERLEAAEMPPEGTKQPTQTERESVIKWIRNVRQFEAQRNAGDPGPVLARRLSNAEYNYTIRDLTGSDIRPTRTFPVDPANESGFDNTGESLTVSPALLRKYLQAAREVVDHLVLKPDGFSFAQFPVVTDTDRDKYCVRRIIRFYNKQPTKLADYFFAAWRLRLRIDGEVPRNDLNEQLQAIAAEHRVSAKYLKLVWQVLHEAESVGPTASLQIRWLKLPTEALSSQSKAQALQECHQMATFVNTLRRRIEPSFPNLDFNGYHKGSQPFVLWKNRQYAKYRRSYDKAALKTQTDANSQQGSPKNSLDSEIAALLIVPSDEAARQKYVKSFDRFCSVFPNQFYVSERGRDYVGKKREDQEKGRLLSAGFHSMMGYFRDDQPLYDLILGKAEQQEIDRLWQELDFVANAPIRQYAGFLWFERTDSRYMRDPEFDFARAERKEAANEDMIRQLAKLYTAKAKRSGANATMVAAIEKYFVDINKQIQWVKNAKQQAVASHLRDLQVFAAKAFRRPLSKPEQASMLDYYQTLRADQLSHEEAMRDSIVAVLMSPHFLFHVSKPTSGTKRQPLTQFELANRLSYFLWSSMPDERLLAKARAGKLHDPNVLVAEAKRMMQDAKVRGLAVEFGGNWLDFRRFRQHNAVDRNRFPEFDDQLRASMFEEPIRFFVDVLQNDRPVTDFVWSPKTLVNQSLAEHYGIANHTFESPDEWKRIDVSEYGRGGLMAMAVFLTKNAPGLRTSPVKRGYWVVRRLLGERIPPPPPNVPELPADESKTALSLRAMLAKHRAHPSCAGCHDRFDSIGVAFERFDPIGRLRTKDLGGRPVLTTAEFPDGKERSGILGVKEYIGEHRQQDFVNNLSRKLLSYALGRSLLLSDELVISEMKTNLAQQENRFSSIVETIVLSPQFRMKR